MANRSSMTPRSANKLSKAGASLKGKNASAAVKAGKAVKQSATSARYLAPQVSLEPSSAKDQRPAQTPQASSVSAEQRAAAARIRITYDKKRGHKTEGWIKRLARGA